MLTRMLVPTALTLPLAVALSALPAGTPAMAGSSAAIANQKSVPATQSRSAAPPPAILAVGDIPSCGHGFPNPDWRAIDTASLAQKLQGTVQGFLGLGDQNNGTGTASEFANCYAKSGWGNLFNITHPSPGNHEYMTKNAAGYFWYFGSKAGTVAKPYYSFDFAGWHFVSLDSECQEVPGGCGPGSPQETWLANDLASFRSVHPNRCILAFWHRPLFSSSVAASPGKYATSQVLPFWTDLYANRAAIVLNGHYHSYERFDPQSPTAAPEANRGIREFVVATGGSMPYRFRQPPTGQPAANSVLRIYGARGVLRLTLTSATTYNWAFYSTSSATKPIDSSLDKTCPQP